MRCVDCSLVSVTKAIRVFFALLPDETTRGELQRVMSALPSESGRLVAANNLHMTLAFIGLCDQARLTCLHAHAGRVSLSPLTIRLDRFGMFRSRQVLWLGPAREPEGLSGLVLRLREALVPCGYPSEAWPHRPFQAHVSLRYGGRGLPKALNVKPVIWDVSEFALMASRQTSVGVHYDVLARYPKDAGMPLSVGSSVG